MIIAKKSDVQETIRGYENPGGGGGTPHMKGVEMLVGNFELNP